MPVTFDRNRGRASLTEKDLIKNSLVSKTEVQIPNCVQEVAAALDTERIQAPLSLSEASTHDDETYCELDVLEGGYERGEQRALLAAGFRALDERERRLLHLRYFAGLSQPQIAKEVGISPIHVSRLTRRALVKLRHEIGPAVPEALAS